MGKKGLGKVPEKTADKYDAEADRLGLSRAQYIRQCVEIGRTVFQSSGQVDIERLREFTEDPQTPTTASNHVTVGGNISDTILNNLPTEEHRALSKEEIRESVFGTEDEQKNRITDILKQLRREGAIEALVDDGYIKTND